MTDKVRSALKHGGYSNTTLLPGEDKAAFEKMHKDLIAEFEPSGRLEEDIINTLARTMWRKQNLITYRLVDQANRRYSQIREKFFPTPKLPLLANGTPTSVAPSKSSEPIVISRNKPG